MCGVLDNTKADPPQPSFIGLWQLGRPLAWIRSRWLCVPVLRQVYPSQSLTIQRSLHVLTPIILLSTILSITKTLMIAYRCIHSYCEPLVNTLFTSSLAHGS